MICKSFSSCSISDYARKTICKLHVDFCGPYIPKSFFSFAKKKWNCVTACKAMEERQDRTTFRAQRFSNFMYGYVATQTKIQSLVKRSAKLIHLFLPKMLSSSESHPQLLDSNKKVAHSKSNIQHVRIHSPNQNLFVAMINRIFQMYKYATVCLFVITRRDHI